MDEQQKDHLGADSAAVDGSMATSADTVASHVAAGDWVRLKGVKRIYQVAFLDGSTVRLHGHPVGFPLSYVREIRRVASTETQQQEIERLRESAGRTIGSLRNQLDELRQVAEEAFYGGTPEQSEDGEIVRVVTQIARAADAAFMKSGGSTRHWVRDCFLPRLNAAGWQLVGCASVVTELSESSGSLPSAAQKD